MNNIERLRHALESVFQGDLVEIRDPRRDGNHLEVTVTSARFSGKSRVECHRMVYGALDTLLTTGALHALAIETRTP